MCKAKKMLYFLSQYDKKMAKATLNNDVFNTHFSKSLSAYSPTTYQTFQLSRAADGTSYCPFLPILLPLSDFCRPTHMQEHQRALRIEHSWHCWVYIFHTQATVLQNTPAPSCPISSSGTGGASFPPFPPTLPLNRSSPLRQVPDKPSAQTRSMTTLESIYEKRDV